MADRRAFDAAQAAHISRVVEAAVNHRLDARFSLKKNGSGWLQYFTEKWQLVFAIGTFIVSVVTFIFVLGGRAVKLEMSSEQAIELARTTAETNERLTREQEAMRLIIDAQAKSIETGEQMHATKSDVAAVREAVRLSPTRLEFQRVLREQLMPGLEDLGRRLDNIERQLRSQ